MVMPFAGAINFFLACLSLIPGPFISFLVVSAALSLLAFVIYKVTNA